MKVLKFGGTSVGTPESILKVREIVVSRTEAPVVVVSALGGVTDQLIRSARLAEEGDAAFRDEIAAMRERHVSVCRAVVPADRRSEIEAELNIMLDRLSSICEGVFLLKGAVKDVADALECSQASVYRYLSAIRKEEA